MNHDQINSIRKQIEGIDLDDNDTAMMAAGEITYILQKDSNADKDAKAGDLRALFNSFKNKKKSEEGGAERFVESGAREGIGVQAAEDIRYWHFNMLYEEQQIESFKNGNWVLALIEYGEDWRTNSIRQVRPGDVIFLFKRGGDGYVGAFKALNPTSKILESERSGEYGESEIAKFDIYSGLEDGASLCSNLLVEPIAYNFRGVGYYTVRRRTIERMHDPDAVKFLLNRFAGNDLDETRRSGKGFLDAETKVDVNDGYFQTIMSLIAAES